MWLCTSFFYRSGAYPVLHSFPTRRSSDLDERDGAARLGVELEARDRPVGVPLAVAEPVRVGVEPEDRKSTRLNSSHVETSYAVFCLKKKKLCPMHNETTPSVNDSPTHVTL